MHFCFDSHGKLNELVFPSTEIRVSPTKPCGKGSKRKQDELDEEEDEEHPTWVEALTQELTEDVGPEEDPDYEVSYFPTCIGYCFYFKKK